MINRVASIADECRAGPVGGWSQAIKKKSTGQPVSSRWALLGSPSSILQCSSTVATACVSTGFKRARCGRPGDTRCTGVCRSHSTVSVWGSADDTACFPGAVFLS